MQVGAIPQLTAPTPITDADQGVMLSWEEDTAAYCASGTEKGCSAQVVASSTFNIARTSEASLVSSSTVNLPNQAGPLQPGVQRPDGSFVGTVEGRGKGGRGQPESLSE